FSQQQKALLLRRTGLLFLLIIPALLLLYAIAPLFYSMLFPNFMESISLFRILLLPLLFSPILLLRTGFIAWRNQKQLYTLYMTSCTSRRKVILIGGTLFCITIMILSNCIEKIIYSLITLVLLQKA